MTDKFDQKYRASVEAGVAHVGSNVQGEVTRGEIERKLNYIKTQTGDPYACILGLIWHSLGKGLMAWFREGDLGQFKQHLYEAAKLERIAFHYRPDRRFGEQDYFCALLADNTVLLNWFIEHASTTALDRDNPKKHLFRHAQMMYALRGDWERVIARAQQAIEVAHPSQKNFMVDQHFYIALARGDLTGMEAALTELTSPKMARVRNNQFDFSYTHFFIGTHAVMYAKLAWLHGYQVKVDTPYIPSEWLPITPLKTYTDPYDFMREFDIQAPLKPV